MGFAALVLGAVLSSALQMPGARASRADDDPVTPRGSAAQTSVKANESGVVRLDRGGQEKGGIETAPPIAADFQNHIRAYGTVLSLDRLTALYNAALTNDAQLRAAEVKLSASRTANARAQDLLKVFSTAKAQAEAAEAAFEIDSVGVDAAKTQVEALRNTATQDWGPVLGAAVATRSAVIEDLVRRKTSLIQLSLEPGVAVSPPQRVMLAIGDGRQVVARLVSEATQIDPRIQGSAFFYVAPASDGLLPGASVMAFLPAGTAQPGIAVPPSAVVWEAGQPWIYLQTEPDTFRRRRLDEAAAPTPDGGYVVREKTVPIKSALVVNGAQILLSEESRAKIPSDDDDN